MLIYSFTDALVHYFGPQVLFSFHRKCFFLKGRFYFDDEALKQNDFGLATKRLDVIDPAAPPPVLLSFILQKTEWKKAAWRLWKQRGFEGKKGQIRHGTGKKTHSLCQIWAQWKWLAPSCTAKNIFLAKKSIVLHLHDRPEFGCPTETNIKSTHQVLLQISLAKCRVASSIPQEGIHLLPSISG